MRLQLLFLLSGVSLGLPASAQPRAAALLPAEARPVLLAEPVAANSPLNNLARQRPELTANSPLKLVALLHHPKALAGIHDVSLQGNYAYVAGKGPEGTMVEGRGSFAIIDITDPRKAFIAGSITQGLTNAETVFVDGDVCFVGGNQFLAVDVSDKANPRVLAKLEDKLIRSINGMVKIGGYLYAASKGKHITVYDVRDPRQPRLAAVHPTAGAFRSPHDIDRLDDERIVVVNIDPKRGEEQLRVYRAAQRGTGEPLPPDQWVLEGSLDDQRLRGANRVRVRHGYAFVMCNKGHGVGVVDVRNPAKPALTDWHATADDPRYKSCGMDVAGNVVIAAGSGIIGFFGLDLPRLNLLGEYGFTDPIPNRDAIYRGEQVVVRVQALVSPDHDLVYRDGFLYTSDQDQDTFAIFEIVDPVLRGQLDRKR